MFKGFNILSALSNADVEDDMESFEQDRRGQPFKEDDEDVEVKKISTSLSFENYDLEDRFHIMMMIFRKEWAHLRKILPQNIVVRIPSKFGLKKKRKKKSFHDDSDEELLGCIDKYDDRKELKNFKAGKFSMIDILKQLDDFRKLEVETNNTNNSLRDDNVTKRLKEDFELIFRSYTRHVLDYCINYPDNVLKLANCIKWQEDFFKEEEEEEDQPFDLMDIFFNELKLSINRDFDFKSEIKLEDQLKEIVEILTDLQFLEDHLGSKFPSEYKVTGFYIRTTYTLTVTFLKTKTNELLLLDNHNNNNNKHDKLRLYKWIKETYPALFRPLFKKVKKIQNKKLKFDRLKNLLESLSDSYIHTSSIILTELTQRLIREIFSPNMRPLQIQNDTSVLLYTHGPKELFDMIVIYLDEIIVEFRLKGEILRKVLSCNIQKMIVDYVSGVVEGIKKMDNNNNNNDMDIVRFIPYINDFSNLILYTKQKKKEILDTGILASVAENKSYIGWMDHKNLPTHIDKLGDICLGIMKNRLFSQMRFRMKENLFNHPQYWKIISSSSQKKKTNNPNIFLLLEFVQHRVEDLEDLEEIYRNEIDLEEFFVREYIRRLFFFITSSSSKNNKKELLLLPKVLERDLSHFKKHLDSRTNYRALVTIRKLMMMTTTTTTTTSNYNNYCDFLKSEVLKRFPDLPKVLVLELIQNSKLIKKKNRRRLLMEDVEECFSQREKKIIFVKETLFSRINFEKNE